MPSHLVVAHYHLRPGGVRSEIEGTLPAIVANGRFDRVTFVTGESPEAGWIERSMNSLGGVAVDVFSHPDLGYLPLSGLPPNSAVLSDLCSRILEGCGGSDALLWLHNPALGRNLPLTKAWGLATRRTGAAMLCHHHDFFFDNRWHLWPSIRSSGISSLREAAEAAFDTGPRSIHVAINASDFQILRTTFEGRAFSIPNAFSAVHSTPGGTGRAAKWLAARTGFPGPFWILPTRLLRRKNVAEAVLLARWLRPDARLVTTGAAGSEIEQSYAASLQRAAERDGWNVDFSICAGRADAPQVCDLLSAGEVVLSTSLQEGFGLAFLEGALARRPLLARRLPNVFPSLADAGIDVSMAYDEVFIPAELFSVEDERERQQKLFSKWRNELPAEALEFCDVGSPMIAAPGVFPFSRLTLDAQIEVLKTKGTELHAALAPLNPALAAWRDSPGDYPAAKLTGRALSNHSPQAFASHFARCVELCDSETPASPGAAWRTLELFLADRLGEGNRYPLLLPGHRW